MGFDIKQFGNNIKQGWGNLIKSYTFNLSALLVLFDLYIFSNLSQPGAIEVFILGAHILGPMYLFIKFLIVSFFKLIEKKLIKKEIVSKFILENKLYALIIFLSYLIQLSIIAIIIITLILFFFHNGFIIAMIHIFLGILGVILSPLS